MLRLSRKSDYGLVALKALRGLAPDDALSARELALRNHLPAELTPKVLARLAQAGLVESTLGKGGGYRLARSAELITIGEVVRVLEDEPHLLPCLDGDTCDRFSLCDIRDPLENLHREVMTVLSRMTIAEL